uniref:Succinate dehydrogenase assembly factor 4, mitochondrial n=1 Tax=Ditylum brightwellii TaxID=49249 RepID=A0A7S4SSZ6_9STRA
MPKAIPPSIIKACVQRIFPKAVLKIHPPAATATIHSNYILSNRTSVFRSHHGRNFVSSSSLLTKNADNDDGVKITKTTASNDASPQEDNIQSSSEASSCSQGFPSLDEDDEDDTEEMFVAPHPSLCLDESMKEWGGPRRGGALAEPTRFGDWERKGRCTDF